MQDSSSLSTGEDHLLSFVWSLWAELGVSGWQRNHREFAIDPEMLVLLTAWLRDRDPRLRDEATDWCIRYGQFISAARLKNLLRTSNLGSSEGWPEFAATVNTNSPWRWPADQAQPRDLAPSGKSGIGSFERTSLIYLRVRAFMGVGARAEIVRLFSNEPHDRLGVAQIASHIGYSKRNTAEALDGLEMAGVMQSIRVRNRFEYTAADPGRLLASVGALPSWFPAWTSVAPAIVTIVEFLERAGDLSDSVASVESVTLVRGLADDLAVWGVPIPHLVMADEPAHRLLQRWSLEVLAALSKGDPKFLAPRQQLEEQSRQTRSK